MRLMLHTFKKDVRRLWPAALAVWVMFAGLASVERWRVLSYEVLGESYLTLLTTMAWACLVALAVLEEPLVGDRNFWTTRPHRWPALLGAKLLFAAFLIHLPSFLAGMFALAGRGFSPVACFGPLLWKQVLFFAAITLPFIALASLVRSFTHFIILVFAGATGVLMVAGVFGNILVLTTPHDEVRQAAVGLSITAAALAAIWIQYALRRVIPARVIVIAGALVSALFFGLLSAQAEYAMPGTGSQEPPRISLRDATSDDAVRNRLGNWQAATIPIEIAPTVGRDRFHISAVQVEVEMPDGVTLHSFPQVINRYAFVRRIDAYATTYFPSGDSPRGWLWLRVNNKPAWERAKNARVHIRGAATFEFYRPGRTTTIPAQGRHSVPDLGWCTTAPQEDQFSGKTSALRLVCESLQDRPAASVALRHDASGWKSQVDLGPPGRRSGLHERWFSSLHFGEFFFQILTDERRTSYPGAAGFMLPEAYVPSATLEITPEIPTGHALARFDLGEVTLAKWLPAR
jgi:hypothetical protein